jgi:hypothetical protein
MVNGWAHCQPVGAAKVETSGSWDWNGHEKCAARLEFIGGITVSAVPIAVNHIVADRIAATRVK